MKHTPKAATMRNPQPTHPAWSHIDEWIRHPGIRTTALIALLATLIAITTIALASPLAAILASATGTLIQTAQHHRRRATRTLR